jgi:hypothetical protein
MLLLIHLAVIITLISVIVHLHRSSYAEESLFFSYAGLVIAIAIMVGVYSGSYNSYVDLREYKDGLVLQHDLKALKALSATIKNDDNLVAETKDGYYEGLMGSILSAKHRINDYNRSIISKRLYGSNWFYGWYVIEPDTNMTLIDVSHYEFGIGE